MATAQSVGAVGLAQGTAAAISGGFATLGGATTWLATGSLRATSEATEEMNPETFSLPTQNHSSTSLSPLNSNPAPKDRDPKDRGDASDSKNSPETKGWLYKWTNYIKGKRNKEIIKL